MAHNTRIKPQAADTLGLTIEMSHIGTNIGNCRVLATHFTYSYTNDAIYFDAVYFWNNAAVDAWLLDNGAVNPIKSENLSIQGIDLDKSIIDQCLDYLLTLDAFNGSQINTLPWVKQ